MLVEIFEQASISSEKSDLDLLLDRAITILEEKGVQVKRYDKLANPDDFNRVEGFALPVIMKDGEIECAGSYDLTFLENAFSGKCATGGCCLESGSANKCAGCPSRGKCGRKDI